MITVLAYVGLGTVIVAVCVPVSLAIALPVCYWLEAWKARAGR